MQNVQNNTQSTTNRPHSRQTSSAPAKPQPKRPVATTKGKKKSSKKKEGYWSKLDRAEIRRLKFYIFSIQIVVIIIILLNSMYESIIIDPFYFPLGYLLLFIIFLFFLISVEGLWFKYVSIKNARSFKKRDKLIKSNRLSAQSTLVVAIVVLIIMLSLNFLPFISDLISSEDTFQLSNTETEHLASFEDQDVLGLTHSTNINFDSNETVELKLHSRELTKDAESAKTEENNLGNHTELGYGLTNPNFQLGYVKNKEYHFFITNVDRTNVSGKYSIQREVSRPFVFNIIFFMILFIIVSVCWLVYLNVAWKKFKKSYDEKVAEVEKRYAVKPYTIEDVFLIYSDGTLITHQTRRIKPLDNDILSGMLTAIKDFIRDVFKEDARDELNELKFGKFKIMIESGQFAFLAVVVTGTPPKDLQKRMKQITTQIHRQFHNELKNYRGQSKRLAPLKTVIDKQFLDAYEKYQQMDVNSDAAWNNKGVILTKLGKFNEALDCFDQALSLNPGVSDTWLNRGIALVKLNEYHEAMDCYDRALQLDPNNENAKRRRNKCWYKWKLLEAREEKITGGRQRRPVGTARPMTEYDYPSTPAPGREYAGSGASAGVGAGGSVTTGGLGGARADYYSEPSYGGSGRASDMYADEPPPRCPNCGQPLRFIDEFESWYCDPCDSYPFDD